MNLAVSVQKQSKGGDDECEPVRIAEGSLPTSFVPGSIIFVEIRGRLRRKEVVRHSMKPGQTEITISGESAEFPQNLGKVRHTLSGLYVHF